MASKYTKLPNVVFEWMPHLKGSELQVLLVIIRHTLGWHKERDAIATSTFMRETGLSNRGVMNALYRLESVKIVHRYAEGKTHSYSLDFECDPDWKSAIGEHTSSVNSVHRFGEESSPISPKIGEDSSHSKERFKDNLKEKLPDGSGDGGKSGKGKRKRDPLLDHPAVVAYREVCHLTPNHQQRAAIAAGVEDDLKWRGVLVDWMNHGWKPTNIPGMIDRYATGPKQDTKSRNGKPARPSVPDLTAEDRYAEFE